MKRDKNILNEILCALEDAMGERETSRLPRKSQSIEVVAELPEEEEFDDIHDEYDRDDLDDDIHDDEELLEDDEEDLEEEKGRKSFKEFFRR